MQKLSLTRIIEVSVILTLLGGAFVPASATAVTIRDFTLVNTSATAANDLMVTLNQPVSTVRSNRIFDAAIPPNDTGNRFVTSVTRMPSPFQVKYTIPTNAQTVATGGSTHITLETVAAQIKGKGFSVDPNPNLTFFTIGGAKVPPAAGFDIERQDRQCKYRHRARSDYSYRISVGKQSHRRLPVHRRAQVFHRADCCAGTDIRRQE